MKKNTINNVAIINLKITNLKPSKNIKNEVFKNEVYFDSEDELSAEKEIERLIVKKQESFYNYYN